MTRIGMQLQNLPLGAEMNARLSEAFDLLQGQIQDRLQQGAHQHSTLLQLQNSLEKIRRRLTADDDSLSMFCLSLDENACFLEVSPACAAFFGEPVSRLSGRNFGDFVRPDEREKWEEAFRFAWGARVKTTGNLTFQLGDGTILDTHFECLQETPANASPVLLVALLDVSDCKSIEDALRRIDHVQKNSLAIAADDWLRGVIEQSLAGIYLIQDGQFAYVNQGFCDIFGFESPAQVIKQFAVADLIVPEDKIKVVENIRRRADGDVPELRYTFTGLRRDNRPVDVEVHGRRMMFEGRPAVIGVILDVSERKQAEQQLRIAATTFESREGMFVADANGIILRINEAFSTITGYASDETIGRTPAMLRAESPADPLFDAVWESVGKTGAWQGEIKNQRKCGECYPAWMTVTAVRNQEAQITHYVGTLSDMTASKAAEAEIEYLAFYDQLTGLPNRRLLIDRLQQALAARTRNGCEGALLFIDLDNFKDINDTLGHDKGDLLLQQVAERLRQCVREGDTIARLGGDEFIMMVEGLSKNPDEAAAQSRVIGEDILEALNKPYPFADQEHHSTPSIGVALFSDPHTTADELLKRADLAMYKAKEAGRNTLCFFDPDMQASVLARTLMEKEMRAGLRDGQFFLCYQPQVSRTGALTGAEALLRWRHPQRGLVSPREFIPIAEASGLILPLGYWVLETACCQLANWAGKPEMAKLSMAVNVSARQFHHPDFVDQVQAVLRDTGADPGLLKLELTESLLLADVEDVIAKMTALKRSGVCFSLDDFGTGYSSLAYLKRLPLDQLKIDQSFVSDVVANDNDAAITGTIVALAQNLGLSVIAEGVETEEQRTFLASQGCFAYQGYLFGRPEGIEVFERLMTGENEQVLSVSDLIVDPRLSATDHQKN